MAQTPPLIPQQNPALLDAIAAHLAVNGARISAIEFQGQKIWVKQQERLALRFRLQKGDPKAAFAAERAAHHTLQSAGVPVPTILAEGPDFIATSDNGPPLQHLLWWGIDSPDKHTSAFHAAGTELAAMHAKNLSHGRPSIKDICWENGQITFLDFERFHSKRNTPKGHMQDLVMFVFSAYAASGKDCPEIEAAIEGYRANDPDQIWQRASLWCRKMRWLDYVTKPIQWLPAGKAREFKAIPLTLNAFART